MSEFEPYGPITLGALRDFLEHLGYAISLYRLHFDDHIETFLWEKISSNGNDKLDLPVKAWIIEKFGESEHIVHLTVFIKEE